MTLPQLKRIRWGVRATLMLGIAASVIANVLHARDNPISQAIAAWPPLALLLTVELISRLPVQKKGLAAARLCATATISGIAAWVSYWHMAGVAARYGESGAAPYLIPLSVDGLIVVASICLVELNGRIRQPEPQRPADVSETVTATPATVAFDYAEPIGPQPAIDDAADVRPPVKRAAPKAATNAEKVIRVARRNPSANVVEIAVKAGVSESTARRYIPAGHAALQRPNLTSPTSSPPAETSQERVNGNPPQLEEAHR